MSAPYGGHLATAGVRLMKQHKPDNWQKLCTIIHGVPGQETHSYGKPGTAAFYEREVPTLRFSRIRPWFHENPEIAADPEKAVLFYLTSNKWMTDPPEWWGTIPFVNELLETLLAATDTGEITICCRISTRKKLKVVELPRGILRAERLGRRMWHMPFDFTTDQVECDGHKYKVVDVKFAADVPEPKAAAEVPVPKKKISTLDVSSRQALREKAIRTVIAKGWGPATVGRFKFREEVRREAGQPETAIGFKDSTIDKHTRKILAQEKMGK